MKGPCRSNNYIFRTLHICCAFIIFYSISEWYGLSAAQTVLAESSSDEANIRGCLLLEPRDGDVLTPPFKIRTINKNSNEVPRCNLTAERTTPHLRRVTTFSQMQNTTATMKKHVPASTPLRLTLNSFGQTGQIINTKTITVLTSPIRGTISFKAKGDASQFTGEAKDIRHPKRRLKILVYKKAAVYNPNNQITYAKTIRTRKKTGKFTYTIPDEDKKGDLWKYTFNVLTKGGTAQALLGNEEQWFFQGEGIRGSNFRRIFNWSDPDQGCPRRHTVDHNFSIWLNDKNEINLTASSGFKNLRLRGDTLADLALDCHEIANFSQEDDRTKWMARHWVGSVYIGVDGREGIGIGHQERRELPLKDPHADDYLERFFSLEFTHDGGANFEQLPDTDGEITHLLMGHYEEPDRTVPYKVGPHENGQMVYDFQHGDVRMFFKQNPAGLQKQGTCMARSTNPFDKNSWEIAKAIDENGRAVWGPMAYHDRYRDKYAPEDAICATIKVADRPIGAYSPNVRWNEDLERWIAIQPDSRRRTDGPSVTGIYFTTNSDLDEMQKWSARHLVFKSDAYAPTIPDDPYQLYFYSPLLVNDGKDPADRNYSKMTGKNRQRPLRLLLTMWNRGEKINEDVEDLLLDRDIVSFDVWFSADAAR